MKTLKNLVAVAMLAVAGSNLVAGFDVELRQAKEALSDAVAKVVEMRTDKQPHSAIEVDAAITAALEKASAVRELFERKEGEPIVIAQAATFPALKTQEDALLAMRADIADAVTHEQRVLLAKQAGAVSAVVVPAAVAAVYFRDNIANAVTRAADSTKTLLKRVRGGEPVEKTRFERLKDAASERLNAAKQKVNSFRSAPVQKTRFERLKDAVKAQADKLRGHNKQQEKTRVELFKDALNNHKRSVAAGIGAVAATSAAAAAYYLGGVSVAEPAIAIINETGLANVSNATAGFVADASSVLTGYAGTALAAVVTGAGVVYLKLRKAPVQPNNDVDVDSSSSEGETPIINDSKSE